MKKTLKILIPVLLVAVIIALLLRGCELTKAADARATETPAPSATVEPTLAPTPKPTPAPTASPKPTATPKPTETPAPVATAAPAATEKPAESAPATQAPSTPAPTEKPVEATTAPTAAPVAPTAAPQPQPTPAPTQKPQPTPAPTPKPTATPAPAHTHSWSESGHSAATCTADGSTTYKCSCGETKTETVAALGHDWQPVYTTEQFPIYGDAEEHKYCNTCKADITGILTEDHREATGCIAGGYHFDWVYPIIGYDTEETLTGYACSRCGETKAP